MHKKRSINGQRSRRDLNLLANTKAQVALMVIVGVVFLFALALIFFISDRDEVSSQVPSKAPRSFIEDCITQAVKPSLNKVLDNGGLIIPEHFIMRRDRAYNYLCYVDVYYAKCYNYYPSLHLISQEQIRVDSRQRVKACFDSLIKDYESQNLEVEAGELEYDIAIIPGSISVSANKDIFTTKGDGSSDFFSEFSIRIPSDLYDLIGISRSIVNQEAEHCYFENNGFMVLYPTYNITKISYRESKLYEVENRITKESFKFATRSCPFAPGIWSGGVDSGLIGQVRNVEDVRQFRDNYERGDDLDDEEL